jgi:hypothetical protein
MVFFIEWGFANVTHRVTPFGRSPERAVRNATTAMKERQVW